MGVQGLWTILAPCARPIKLETLAHKRLAVDASIWIYQFLKAVRDKEGNALRNSHVVGFFRRICKLLFFGIKPVFVFDGGAPVLKRQTIAARKGRREGRREDALRTAGRLLAVQIRRRMEEEKKQRERERREYGGIRGSKMKQRGGRIWEVNGRNEPAEEPMPENPVYVEELTMTPQQRKQNRAFKKQDPYHLPDLDMSIEHMGAPNDPRIMSQEELTFYASQFRENGDGESNVNLYDFSKIDFSSPFFLSLPMADQYAILSAARLRSRLRMGLSKEQLASMFPNRLDFSKFQIERVRERNELTQRLMNLNGMNAGGDTYEAIYGAGRVAGEKGREYVLVKNDGVEGGWVLGVVGRKEGMIAPRLPGQEKFVEKTVPGASINKPIVLDAPQSRPVIIKGDSDEDDDDDDEFEDVPIEGLNRLPKLAPRPVEDIDNDLSLIELERQQLRQAIYNSKLDQVRIQRQQQGVKPGELDGEDSLFITHEEDELMQDADVDELFSPTGENMDDVDGIDQQMKEDDENFRQVIGASMNDAAADQGYVDVDNYYDEEDFRRAIKLSEKEQSQFQRPQKIDKGKQPVYDISEDEEFEDIDLQAAIRESKRANPSTSGAVKVGESSTSSSIAKVTSNNLFGGLLPFESIPLDFGNSILRKKRKGDDKPAPQLQQDPFKSISLDFNGNIFGKKRNEQEKTPSSQADGVEIDVDVRESDVLEEQQGGFIREDTTIATDTPKERGFGDDKFKRLPLPPWFSKATDIRKELILEEEALEKERMERVDRDEEIIYNPSPRQLEKEVVVISSESEEQDEADDSDIEMLDVLPKKLQKEKKVVEAHKVGNVIYDDLAELVRAVPPTLKPLQEKDGEAGKPPGREVVEENSKRIDDEVEEKLEAAGGELVGKIDESGMKPEKHVHGGESDEEFEWEASDAGKTAKRRDKTTPTKSQNIIIPTLRKEESSFHPENLTDADVEALAEATDRAIENDYSDPEDEEILHQLHIEAEEHARFASSLKQRDIIDPSKSNIPNPAEMTAEQYERELKSLRMQQKKDRRDADEVTHTMIAECQQLLKLFGLPYITAPMEAEAQCAELVSLGLVDGIVTDDSDCFLFGGTKVYKNMFNQAKYVECYLLADLEKEFGLDRKKLISLAHLLGSDYTEGLPGVGPVTALELLTDFASSPDGLVKDEPPSAPLRRFKIWWDQVQHAGGTTYDSSNDTPFRRKFTKSHSSKLFLPMSFPVAEVDDAYLRPETDKDPSRFEWGVPDLDGLRQFLIETIGWSQERTDEILVPVVKDMNRRLAEGTQSNITRWFDGSIGAGAFAPRKREVGKSKRMDRAMQRLHQLARRGKKSASAGTEENGEGDRERGGRAALLGPADTATPISMSEAAKRASPVMNRGGKKSARGGKKTSVAGRKRQRKVVHSDSSSSGSPLSDEEFENDDEDEDGGSQSMGNNEDLGQSDQDSAVKGRKRTVPVEGARGRETAKRGKRGRGGGTSTASSRGRGKV